MKVATITAVNFPQAGADPRVLDRMIDVAMSIWPSSLLRDSGRKGQPSTAKGS